MIAREVGKEGEREKERGGGRRRRRGERKGIDTCIERERDSKYMDIQTYVHVYLSLLSRILHSPERASYEDVETS